MTDLVCVDSLTKKYLNRTALSDVTFDLTEGRILGLLGPNGSGKTTLMKILAGVLSPSSGTVRIDGKAPGIETKAEVSFLPDVNQLDRWMTIRETGDFFRDFYPDFDEKKFQELLKVMRLTAGQKISSLSKGMIEKARLSLAFARSAKLFILDEPFGGLDPLARSQVLTAIVDNFREGCSMILSTHMVADVERFFDDVVFLDDGCIIRTGEAEELRTQEGKSIEELYREVYGNVETH
jgi:ABC-2 type transport system ATP-binding protein